MNVSIAGAPPSDEELAAFTLYEDLGSLIFQSAPNVNQGDFDWGSVYSDVVNVGAWNVANNGELLISSPNTLETVDILADGYVARDGWTTNYNSGWNFGTSFASPKVAAEFLNVVNSALLEVDLPDSTDENTETLDFNYTELVDSVVDFLSSDVDFTLIGYDTPFKLPVLNSTLEENGPFPKSIDTKWLDWGNCFNASIFVPNNEPTGQVYNFRRFD